ncbi:MAG TPA: C25 family cysteine peptidase [bacterium]
MTSISMQTPAVMMREQVVDFQTYQSFGIAGEVSIPTEGSPSIPQVSRLYRIPNTGGADLVITNADFELVENITPYPVQPEVSAFGQLVRDEALYSKDGWYPANPVVMSDPMIMRDFRVVSVTLYPVQVNPVTHQARIYRNLSADVVANDRPSVNELVTPRRPTGSWVPIYRTVIANLDENALLDATTTPGSYLILCKPDAQSVNPFVDSLFQWKTRQGYRVIVDSRSNWDAGTMQTRIRQLYASQDPPLEYVCLMGGVFASFGVPTSNSDYDHAFALGNTGDDLEDVGVGRLTGGTSAEMALINAKIMSYERNPRMESSPGVADTMWFHKAFLLAGTAMSCASNYLLMEWGASQFTQFTDVDSVRVETVQGTPQATQCNPHFQNGIGFFLWRGAWISEVNTGLAAGCNSGWRLPICLAITCTAGDFTGSNGMAPSFLTAGTVSNPKGGVCGIGSTTAGTHNPENITFTGGLLYNIINLNVENLGTCMSGAKALLYTTFADWSGFAGQFSRYNNLFGEPSLSIWTTAPKVLNVTHPTALNIGARSVDVVVHRDADGVPVQDAVVCLWKRGADSTWVRGMTDVNGHVVLPVSVNAAGDMYLTVTKQNHKPYLFTIPCGSVDCMPMASSHTVDDDNNGGTQGNGNHIMNPGETIDLPVYIRNFGASVTATGVSATMTSTNPRVTVVTGTASYANIAPGDSALGAQPFRIQVAGNLQDGVTVQLLLAITSSAGTTNGLVELTCAAGDLEYTRYQFTNGAFGPGLTRNLSVTVLNAGAVSLIGVTGHLQSLSPFVTLGTADATYGDIAAGAQDSNTTAPFVLTANPLTFNGHQAPMMLVMSTPSGASDTVMFMVNVGTAQSTDPTGPDAYGYYAYDNTDLSYDIHPVFQYVDISSNSANNLNLNDVGEKTSTSELWSTVRPLPFRFKYYGRFYDSVTVCSNGWCALGNQAWFDNFRNYPIPAPQAPEAMIAPYWDDLITTGGAGLGVFATYQPDSGRYVIQWKATGRNTPPSPLDFEVILYDSAARPTLDGNGAIVMQYNQAVMNIDPPEYDEREGCTIGIQAPRSLMGLSYAYVTDYAPGAATIQNGRSILFTTDARVLFGQVEGHVYDARTNQPLAGVHVSTDRYPFNDTTDATGYYHLTNVVIGTYHVMTSAYRFNGDTASNVFVALDSTTTLDFHINHPEMALSVSTIEDSTLGGSVQTAFTINNAGNGPLDWTTSIYFAGDNNPAPWDSVASVPVSQLTQDDQAWGCEFMNGNWWVTGSNGLTGQGLIYRFDDHGTYLGSIPQPGSSATGWFDIATDGTYLYGSDSHVIIGINANGQVHDTIPSPLNPSRALAYDPALGYFWAADYTSNLYCLDRSGGIVVEVTNPGLNITGMAWNATDANGYKLYIFSRDGEGLTRVSKFNPTARQFQTVVDLPSAAGDRAAGCTITPNWNSTLLVFGGVIRGTTGSRLAIHEMVFNSTWMHLVPSTGTVAGTGSQDVQITFDPTILRNDTYHVNLRVSSAVYDSTIIVPVTLVVNRITAVEKPARQIPAEFALRQNYPNPFNPTTQIAFDLPKAEHVRLDVFNSLGQHITTLLDETRAAASYAVTWDGRTAGGADVSSGVYFYQVRAGSFTAVNKMLLMR